MGLATARVLAQAGRDVVVCEQFEVGHDSGSSHGGSRIVRLSYPDERWVRLAQEAYPLWQELEAGVGPCAARPARNARPRRLGGEPASADRLWSPVRGAGHEPRSSGASRSGSRTARAGSSRRTAGSSTPTWRCRPFSAAATAGGAELRERTRVESIEDEGETVSLDGLRAKAVVVTAGAWAPGLVGVDATPDARDDVVLRVRRAGALRDRHGYRESARTMRSQLRETG